MTSTPRFIWLDRGKGIADNPNLVGVTRWQQGLVDEDCGQMQKWEVGAAQGARWERRAAQLAGSDEAKGCGV